MLIDLNGATVFSQIDLKMGFYQIPIDNRDTYKTAFSLMGRKYEFLRLPFGMRNAPFIFQMNIVKILGKYDFCKIYVDDILISSKTHEEHYRHVDTVLKELTRANIGINFEKSQFAKPKVTYLGQIISQYGIRPDTKPLDKLINIPTPNTVRKTNQIIGLLQWFRPYIQNLNIKISPITDLLKMKNQPIKWTEVHNSILEDLLSDINNEKILKRPNINNKFYLETDASNCGAGAVLKQAHGVIGYYSKKFNDAESNYSIVEREFYAIICALRHFRKIILGCKTEIKTDNKNLLNYQKINSNRIDRWSWILSDYDMELKHIKGVENVVADNISRSCKTTIKPDTNTHDRLKSILREFKTTPTIKLSMEIHDKLGHPGNNKMRRFLHDQTRSTKYTKATCKNCITCQKIKHDHTKKFKMSGTLSSLTPRTHISTDICGPISLNEKNKEPQKHYIITFTCRMSRFTEISVVKNIESRTILNSLKNKWIITHGNPKSILCDNGRQYTSRNFKLFCESNNIKLNHCTPNNPRGNGITERINKTINEIARYMKKGYSKSDLEDTIYLRLNPLHHKTTNMSPYALIHPTPYLYENIPTLQNKQKLAQDNIKKNNEYEISRKKTIGKRVNIKLGDPIFVKNKTSLKQDFVYDGPYQVVEIKRNFIKYKKNNNIRKVCLRNVKQYKKEG